MSLPRPMLRFAAVLAVVSGLLGLAAATASAAERNFSLRYSNNVNGQITMAANTIMQCPTDTVDPLMNSGCEGARAGTNARNNNSFDMRWLDVDSDPSTFTSSSAQLLMPAGSRVLFAGLYWTGLNKKGEAISGANGFRAVPRDPPSVAAIGTVKIRAPRANAYTSVTAAPGNLNTASIAVGGGYGAFADVTSIVAAAGAGTYTVADVQTGTGGNAYAGWSLVVAYSNPDEPLRNLSVFDGLRVVSGTQQLDIPLSGFKTPTTGEVRTTVGVVAAEGDAGATGDYLTVNDVRLTDAVHPPNNTENATIANRGAHVTTKNPDWRNNLGYDSSLFSADGILPNGATSAIFRAKTNGDTYAPQAITFATELFSPDVVLTKTSPAGQDSPGATKTYTITATNGGTANATDVVINDPLPAGFVRTSGPTVTAGTATAVWDADRNEAVVYAGTGSSNGVGGVLAPNASVTFTITGTIGMDVPLGEVITNATTLQFVSPDLGLPLSVVADDDTTVRYPDPGISKTVASASGNQYTFELLVTNQGTIGTTGSVTINDSVPTGATLGALSGTGWSCSTTGSPATDFSCTRSDTLAAGASYPPVGVEMTFAPGADVKNTATLANGSGGEPNDAASPARLNNLSTVGAGLSPLANLRVNKAALTGTINPGTLAGFRIEVRNDGPSPATGATLVDELDSRLTYQYSTTTQGSCSTAAGPGSATTLSCALGTIPVGGTATVVVRALTAAVGGAQYTVPNTATANSGVTPSPVSNSATLTVRAAADVGVTKSTPANVQPGDPFTYTLTATNSTSGVTATNVRMVDRLPEGLTVGTLPSGCTASGQVVTCTQASLVAGTPWVVTIPVTAPASPSAAGRELVNTVNVFSSTPDPNTANNQAQVTSYIVNVADLQVNAAGPGAISAGGTGEIAFVTTNNGPSTATGSSLVVEVPAGLTPVTVPAGCSVLGQTVTCALGDLADQASATTTIGVQVQPGVVSVQA